MEGRKAKTQSAAGATARGAKGLAAAADIWIGRFLNYGCIAGDPSGWPGLALHAESLRRGQQGQADT